MSGTVKTGAIMPAVNRALGRASFSPEACRWLY
jgi:hypothetical protein